MLSFAATAFITLLVVIDPIGTLPVFMTLTKMQTSAQRRQTAIRSVVVAALTLIVFALSGNAMFHFLGISLAAFEIAGGLLLLLLSIDMLLVRQSGFRTTTAVETNEAADSADVAVFPLAVPLIAGPGAMTSVILLMGRAEGSILQKTAAIVLMVVVLSICLLSLLFASKLVNHLSTTAINVIGRVFGIVLAGLSVQYILDGLLAAFPTLGAH